MAQADWPRLDYSEWSGTLRSLHMWSQILGKVRLVTSPWLNHSWHVPLYVTPVGLTTSTMYHRAGAFDIELDFHEHAVRVRTDRGEHRALRLREQSVATFHADLMSALDDLGFSVEILEVPSEIPDPIPFDEDTVVGAYDPDAASRFARVLNSTTRVFTQFRARFLGKSSPVHFFWGSFDLAVTRFSGRPAPEHPGGIPGLPDWITREAYSHEVYSCGFWPGGEMSPAAAFYSYAYPTPDGFSSAPVQPAEAFWSEEMGEYFLPYEAVRTSSDPDAALRDFLRSTYNAVADLAEWDRDKLEVPSDFPHQFR